MYIPRNLTPKLLDLATKFPIVTVCGPRQSGKTTLVQKAFPPAVPADLILAAFKTQFS